MFKMIMLYPDNIKPKKCKNERVEVIDKYTREIIPFYKNHETIQKIIDISPKVKQYYSD